MKLRSFFAAAVLGLALSRSGAAAPRGLAPGRAVRTITAARAYGSVAFLTSEACAGRLTGTPGYEAAARWASEEFHAIGLRPLPGEKGHLLPFPVSLFGVCAASLEILSARTAGEAPRVAVMGKDFMPMWASDSCEGEAEVVFAGFGITAPELARDDYAGVDVRGRVAMILRGTPDDGRSWKGHGDTPSRAANAKAHGAVALLIVDNPVLSVHIGRESGLGMAMLAEEFADVLLGGSKLKSAELRKVLAKGGSASFSTGRTVRFKVEALPEKPVTAWNVAGYLPGSGDAGGYLLIGAHLDHVGEWPELNPGANDNASGAAAVLEVARAAATLKARPKQAIVFALFGGEEMGLLGAKRMAGNLPKALGACTGVYNLDMVGQGTGLWVAGGTLFPDLYQALVAGRDAVDAGFRLEAGGSSGEARADHRPFMDAGIPAVSLFGAWGVSHGYHTPGDTLYWLTPRTIETTARAVFLAVCALADKPPEVPPKASPGSEAGG